MQRQTSVWPMNSRRQYPSALIILGPDISRHKKEATPGSARGPHPHHDRDHQNPCYLARLRQLQSHHQRAHSDVRLQLGTWREVKFSFHGALRLNYIDDSSYFF
uniref:Nicotinamide nucleotide adenylyltransferase 2 n=1 Tax=Rousettus aegyptiacus TaxID=9407 RepID=A0A7J8BGM6_ROUAE|nr:nicotinamide nucleotide adenylyltransferase 2 [Rousettus aegyptiacus]